MNFVAHALVAAHHAPGDHELGLGAMAPDLASMGGVRIDRSVLPLGVLAGVRFHAATDDAFHGDPAVRALMGELRARLVAVGLATGPSRAIGHVGLELAIDGVLLDREDARAALHGALAARFEVAAAVGSGGWVGVAGRIAGGGIDQLPYRDPAGTALLLHRILSSRPKLAFPPDQVAVVAGELARTMAAVAPDVDAIVAGTAQRLRVS